MADDTSNVLLIKKAKDGDMRAFEELILLNEKMVFNVVLRMINNPEDAKDISQEVFIKVYKSLNNFNEKSAFSTWIYRVAVNTCIDEIRKRKKVNIISIDEETENGDCAIQKQYADTSETPEERFIQNEDKNQILNAVNELSNDHKTMIVLRDLHGLSYNEISEITGNTLGTVKSKIARARLQLKNMLTKKKEQNTSNSRQKK